MDSPASCPTIAVKCPLQTSPVTQPRVHVLTAQYQCQCPIAFSLLAAKLQRRETFLKSLLHFSKFLVNITFDLVRNYILKIAFNSDSIDILCVRKYCKIFTHESNTFLYCGHTTNIHWNQWTRKAPKPPLFLGGCEPPSNAYRVGQKKVSHYHLSISLLNIDRFS